MVRDVETMPKPISFLGGVLLWISGFIAVFIGVTVVFWSLDAFYGRPVKISEPTRTTVEPEDVPDESQEPAIGLSPSAFEQPVTP